MKKIVNLLLTFMISTTFSFAQTVEVEELAEVSDAIEQMNSVDPATANIKENSDKMLKKLNKEIATANKKKEPLAKSQKRLGKRIDFLVSHKIKYINGVLSNEKKLDKLYAQAVQADAKITKEEFTQNLKKSIDPAVTGDLKGNFMKKLEAAGSYAKLLEQFKSDTESGLSKIEVTSVKSIKNQDRIPAAQIDWAKIGDVLFQILIWSLILGAAIAIGIFIGWGIAVLALVLAGIGTFILIILVLAGGRICSMQTYRHTPDDLLIT